jgi:alpha-glucosidase
MSDNNTPKKSEKITTPPVPPEVEIIAEPIPRSIPFSEVNLSKRYDDVYEVIVPDNITSVRWSAGHYDFICANGVVLRIECLQDGVVRFRYSPNGLWMRDFSYAIVADSPATASLKATLTENQKEYIVSTDTLQVVVSRQDLRIRIFNLDDKVLYEDADGYSACRTIMEGWSDVRLTSVCHRKSIFYGLGDKATEGANLHGQVFENWCTDAYAFGRDSGPMYRAIPFYYTLYQGVASGILFDNSYRSHFDFNKNDDGIVSMRAEGGELNYYFISGPRLTDVSRRYHALTGVHELPPMWALGYHQCRWSYYPESVVQALADRFRAEQIPCDAIYLDIDYMDEYRCFTWNHDHFPKPKKMIEDLQNQGFRTVVMIDPGIKEDPKYAVYEEGIKGGHFVRTSEGPVATAPVWPGFCVFPDYTRPATRAWWGRLYHDLYVEMGVSGFWNDMNEPAVFYVNQKTLPDSVLHDFDGDMTSHRQAHNIYGHQMTRATWEGLRALQPEKRPFLLARATYAGGQRYTAVWTGDNVASWDHLRIANIQCQRLAMSGLSFCGTDIGGFAGDPDGELYTRWLQLSVFHPMMRSHSKGVHAAGDNLGDTLEADQIVGREPWAFGERWTPIARKAIELRYRLLPMIYTAMWQHTTQGIPVLRHVSWANESDPRLWDHDRDFLFGEHLLVSPVVQPKTQRQMVYLPEGHWYYFWTGHTQTGEVFVNVIPDEIPMFIRAGAVLATYPTRQHVDEPMDELTLYAYYDTQKVTTQLYEDAGEGFDYQQDMYALSTFDTLGTATDFCLNRSVKGHWKSAYTHVKVYLIGFPTYVKTCTVDGVPQPIKEIRLRDRSLYTLTISPDFERIEWKA